MFGPGRRTSSHTSLAYSPVHTCLVQVGAPHLNLTHFIRTHTCLVQVGAPNHTPHSLPPRTHVWSRQVHLITHLTCFLLAHMFGPGRRTSSNLTHFLRAHMFGPGRCTSSQTSLASSSRTCLVQVGGPHHTPRSLTPCTHMFGPGRRTSSHTLLTSSMHTCLVQAGAPHHTPHSLPPRAHVWFR
jgi:hypothetical protein